MFCWCFCIQNPWIQLSKIIHDLNKFYEELKPNQPVNWWGFWVFSQSRSSHFCHIDSGSERDVLLVFPGKFNSTDALSITLFSKFITRRRLFCANFGYALKKSSGFRDWQSVIYWHKLYEWITNKVCFRLCPVMYACKIQDDPLFGEVFTRHSYLKKPPTWNGKISIVQIRTLPYSNKPRLP